MISGIWAALPNVFGRFSQRAVGKALERLLNEGIDGFLLSGTTGHGVDYTVGEREDILRQVLGLVSDPGQLIVAVSANAATDVRHLMAHAFDLGVRGIALTPPFYGDYSDAEVGDWSERVFHGMSKTGQIYLYNIPSATHTRWLPAHLTALDEMIGIDGIKDSSGTIDQLQAFVAWARPRDAGVLVGNERLATYGYLVGAHGLVSGLSCALPGLVVSLARAATASDWERAKGFQAEVDAKLGGLKTKTPHEASATLIAWMEENRILEP